MNPKNKVRVVYPPVLAPNDADGAVVSVRLKGDEEVRWIWTHKKSGESFVSGYEIIKKEANQPIRKPFAL